jgi:hypothetical protein
MVHAGSRVEDNGVVCKGDMKASRWYMSGVDDNKVVARHELG